VVAAWKAFLCYKGVVVINGVLSDVTHVSTEVTDEVIVTAVEAGESARKVVHLLMLFFACVARFFLMTLVSTALRSIWGLSSRHTSGGSVPSTGGSRDGSRLSSRRTRMSKNARRIGLEQQVS
jgi:hypothetical protein